MVDIKDKKYDVLVVGCGLYGSVVAHECISRGMSCLIIDKRNHIAGNIYTENIEGIDVHTYGPHIFHTSDEFIWNYVNKIDIFDSFVNSPMAVYNGKIYNLPFNMNTFNQMWGCINPEDAKNIISEQKYHGPVRNLEEHAKSIVGSDIFKYFIEGYTEKQWGRSCSELPIEIIKRLPVRFTYDNNYFNDVYQGIPRHGYTNFISCLIRGADVKLEEDYLKNKIYYNSIAEKIVYSGKIDEYFNYCYGKLQYRSLNFETKILDTDNFQGNAVINYTNKDIPYTRIIEHKHFNKSYKNIDKTVITYEYPCEWNSNNEAYYPINNDVNNELYHKYKELSSKETNVIFGGRLGEYKYNDMDDTIISALSIFDI